MKYLFSSAPEKHQGAHLGLTDRNRDQSSTNVPSNPHFSEVPCSKKGCDFAVLAKPGGKGARKIGENDEGYLINLKPA